MQCEKEVTDFGFADQFPILSHSSPTIRRSCMRPPRARTDGSGSGVYMRRGRQVALQTLKPLISAACQSAWVEGEHP